MTSELKRREMPLDPVAQVRTDNAAGDQREEDCLGLIDGRYQFEAVENEERFEGGMANSLVAVDERMIVDEREGESGALFFDGRIQVDTIEGCSWLS